MESFKLSVKAEEDLTEIYTFGILQFGFSQAQKYVSSLEQTILKLAQAPFLGKDSSVLFPGLREFSHKSHMIFYLVQEESILIVRILHQSRNYKDFI